MNHKTFRRTLAMLCLLLAILSLASCAKTNKFIMSGSSFRDKKTDVIYLDAHPAIEPIKVSDRAYGKSGDLLFYEIEGLDPTKYVSDQSGSVFYAKNLAAPTLSSMQLSMIEIRIEENTARTLGTIRDTEQIATIYDAYANGEEIPYPAYTPVRNLRIRLGDEKLGLCYSLVYVQYEAVYTKTNDDGSVAEYGKCFLYDRFEDRFVKAPQTLIDRIAVIYGEGEETA